jgi:pentatricopeptide repeat protein
MRRSTVLLRCLNSHKRGVICNGAHFSTSIPFLATKTSEAQKISKQIKQYADKGQIESLEQLFNNSEKSAPTYNALIDSYIKAGQLDKANEMLGKMKLEELEPSTTVQAALISACDSFDSAQKVFDSVEESKKDSNIYDALINANVNFGKIDDAVQLLEKELKKEVKPKPKTISNLVRTLATAGSTEKADKVLRLLTANNIEPGTAVYNAVLAGYCAENNIKEATRLFDMLGPEKNRETYRIMLRCYVKSGDTKNAEKLLVKMIERFKNDSATINDILSLYLEEGLHDRVKEVMNFVDKLYGVKLDENNYGTLITGLLRAGKEQEAKEIYDTMVQSGIKPSKSLAEYAQTRTE